VREGEVKKPEKRVSRVMFTADQAPGNRERGEPRGAVLRRKKKKKRGRTRP